jgi:DNA-binding transcriptional regulator LsrR (DeoR family)
VLLLYFARLLMGSSMEQLLRNTTPREAAAVRRYARLRCQRQVARSLRVSQQRVSQLLASASVRLSVALKRDIDVVLIVRGGCSI